MAGRGLIEIEFGSARMRLDKVVESDEADGVVPKGRYLLFAGSIGVVVETVLWERGSRPLISLPE